MKKLISMVACLLFICSGAVWGQGKSVSGTVVDSKGTPAVGVSVIVVGDNTIGTITDNEGKFSLTMPESATRLEFSSITHKTQVVTAKNGMRVIMESTAQELDDVISVGYAKTTTKAYVGSAKMVDGEIIEKKNPSDVTKALAGEFAGVRVISTTGQPGQTATIRIRGTGSVNSSTAPLYVVDGVIYNGDVSSISPSDIASTAVLKDATATSLYGSRGANGVVLITTKKGTSDGEGKIDIDLKYGLNMRLIPLYDMISSPETYTEVGWLGLYTAARYANALGEASAINYANSNLFGARGVNNFYNLWDTPGNSLIDPATQKFYPAVNRRYTPENWSDYIFNTGQKVDATVKFYGGSDKTTYFTSFGYLKDEGYYIQSDYNRFTARSNVDFQPKKWLKGNVNLAYTYSELNNPGQDDNMNNGFQYVNGVPAIYPVFQRDAAGNYVPDLNLGGNAYDYGMYEGFGRLFGSGINPAGALQLDKQISKSHDFNASARFEMEFYKDLIFSVNAGYQYYGTSASALTNKFYGDAAGIGRITKSNATLASLSSTQMLSYKKTIAGVHNLDGFVAHEASILNYATQSGSKAQILRPEGLEWSNAALNTDMSSSTIRRTMDSYFGQIRYNYDEKYFFHGTLRGDGSSRFAKGYRWGTFWSVGLGWLITKEDFMNDTKDWLKTLKLRASVGTNGNQEIGDYRYQNLYQISVMDGKPALYWAYLGNPTLSWEKTQIVNPGLEFEFSKYLSGEVEYFYKRTIDMLFPRYVAPSLGYSYYYVNDGVLSNQGVEAQLNIHAVNTNSVKLDIRLNATHEINRFEKLPLENDGTEMLMNGSASVGHGLYDYYMPEYAGVDPQTGKALYYMYVDESLPVAEQLPISSVYLYELQHPDAKLKKTTTDEYNYAGSNYVGKTGMPDVYGGFGVDLSAYGFDLSVSLNYQIGGWGYDNIYAAAMHGDRFGEFNWHQDIQKAWRKPGDVTDVPRLTNGEDFYTNAASTRFLTSNSNLQLSNVRLGYTLPRKALDKLKLKNLNIWVSGDNLFVLTARRGYAPFSSISGTNDRSQYVPLSTVMCGIKFQF